MSELQVMCYPVLLEPFTVAVMKRENATLRLELNGYFQASGP